MTVRQYPLQHYRYKIASGRCTVKRKQKTTVRAVQLGEVVAEGDFAAEIPGSGSGAGSEDAEKSSYIVAAGSSVHLAIRDGKSGGLVVTGLFSVISAQAGIRSLARGSQPARTAIRGPFPQIGQEFRLLL